jgi:hypothetical protein
VRCGRGALVGETAVSHRKQEKPGFAEIAKAEIGDIPAECRTGNARDLLSECRCGPSARHQSGDRNR